jgi:hypothetical protein
VNTDDVPVGNASTYVDADTHLASATLTEIAPLSGDSAHDLLKPSGGRGTGCALTETGSCAGRGTKGCPLGQTVLMLQ